MTKVCIGTTGRFHAFDLARELNAAGDLTRLYTAYPRWKVDTVPRDKVKTFPWLMVPAAFAGRYGLTWVRDQLNFPTTDTFDRWMAAGLEQCEVFHCLSSFGTRAQRTARERYGALTVCDRGGAHIVVQDLLLREEFARFGIPWQGIDPRSIQRELAEYSYCDLITVPSSFALRSFLAQGVPVEKLRLNPYGVDLSQFKRVPKTDDVFRVLFVGNLTLQKGVPYLLEACSTLVSSKFEVWLIGSLEPEIRPILAKYEGTFRYLGVKPRSELYRYYSQASVLILASIQDGLALVQAQALACGLPVIATTNTGAEDLFDNGVEGFIVPIRDARAIRDRIIQLREAPALREQMGQAALNRVRQIGGWTSYGDRAETIYREALQARRAA